MSDITSTAAPAGVLTPDDNNRRTAQLHRSIMIGLAVVLAIAPFVAYSRRR